MVYRVLPRPFFLGQLTLFFYHALIAPRDYGVVNWDIVNSLPDFYAATIAVRSLKNETLISLVRPYSSDTAFAKGEHDALHSQLNNSETTFPHSFIYRPIHRIPGNFDSEIVATIGGGFAWDFALRNLLPAGVEGILVEIYNNCNQTYSYRIEGPDAYYVGEGATHEQKYNDMKVVRSLSIHTHPNFTTTPGHCLYSIVSR